MMHGRKNIKLTTHVYTAVSKSEKCESCSGSPSKISLQLSARQQGTFMFRGESHLGCYPQTFTVLLDMSLHVLLNYSGIKSAVFTRVFVEYVGFRASSGNR